VCRRFPQSGRRPEPRWPLGRLALLAPFRAAPTGRSGCAGWPSLGSPLRGSAEWSLNQSDRTKQTPNTQDTSLRRSPTVRGRAADHGCLRQDADAAKACRPACELLRFAFPRSPARAFCLAIHGGPYAHSRGRRLRSFKSTTISPDHHPKDVSSIVRRILLLSPFPAVIASIPCAIAPR